MSFNSNWRIVDLVAPGARAPDPARRRLVAAAALSLAGTAWGSAELRVAGERLRPWGRGEFRRFGFHIYDAALWAGDNPSVPPLALRLTYRRSIAGERILQASLDEMRQLGATPAELARWRDRLSGFFPDVVAGDVITGLHEGTGATFDVNGRLLGRIDDPAFAQRFFGIWLDPRSSAPALRAALLQAREG